MRDVTFRQKRLSQEGWMVACVAGIVAISVLAALVYKVSLRPKQAVASRHAVVQFKRITSAKRSPAVTHRIRKKNQNRIAPSKLRLDTARRQVATRPVVVSPLSESSPQPKKRVARAAANSQQLSIETSPLDE